MSNIPLPAELQFLEGLVGDREFQYRKAEWRIEEFDSDVWQTSLGLTIDFRVKLDDGRLLTDRKHRPVLDLFKCWLGIQSHADATGGKMLSSRSIEQRVSMTLHVIDYFLLNARRYKLATYGLRNVTENDVKTLLLALTRSSSVLNGIYRWPDRLEEFVSLGIEKLEQQEFEQLIVNHEVLLASIPSPEDRMLDLSAEEVVRARAWLWKEGYYNRARGVLTPNTKRLSKVIFADTLAGAASSKLIPDEFRLDPSLGYFREFSGVPVKNYDDDRMSGPKLIAYVDVIRRLGLLGQVGLSVPTATLSALDAINLEEFLDLKPIGRYRNLPHGVVFAVIRNSIEFSLSYGEDLIATYLRIAAEAKKAGMSCKSLCYQNGIQIYLTDKLRRIGVKSWSTVDVSRYPFLDLGFESRHQALRANFGLWDLLRVLYGCVQVCVGILTARRQGELSDLIAGKCLDVKKKNLVFFNRKSGTSGLREKEARPIPSAAVQLIGMLEDLQQGLVALGVLEKMTNLFAYPKHSGTGLVTMFDQRYNLTLDCFCDYFETPLNKKGCRFYLRQHQLRRFFAMLFFWGRAFGGMDALRWFFGHTDVEHLYRYVTESISGAALNSIKATYAADQLAEHSQGSEELSNLVEFHFGTRDFAVLDHDELSDYIEDLLADGRVQIEPEFFNTPQGSSYRVLILVKGLQ
jgi:hypothetical protein